MLAEWLPKGHFQVWPDVFSTSHQLPNVRPVHESMIMRGTLTHSSGTQAARGIWNILSLVAARCQAVLHAPFE